MVRAETIRKADMALADLANGGLLETEQSEKFVREMMEQPGILNRARVINMKGPTRVVDKINFGEDFLDAASQDPAATGDYAGRNFTSANRHKPTTSKVLLTSKEVQGIVKLNYETIEDNVERDDFVGLIRSMMAEQASVDIDKLIINGDTGSGNRYLALLDGLLVQTTTNVVNCGGDTLNLSLGIDTKKALPQKYHSSKNLTYFTTTNAELDYRDSLSARGTALGDAIINGTAPARLHGHPIQTVHKMAAGNALFCDAKNVIVGIQRQMNMEVDRNIETREIIIVLTMRLDVKFEEESAVVKLTNLGS